MVRVGERSQVVLELFNFFPYQIAQGFVSLHLSQEPESACNIQEHVGCIILPNN